MTSGMAKLQADNKKDADEIKVLRKKIKARKEMIRRKRRELGGSKRSNGQR